MKYKVGLWKIRKPNTMFSHAKVLEVGKTNLIGCLCRPDGRLQSESWDLDGRFGPTTSAYDLIEPLEEPISAEPAIKYGVGLWNVTGKISAKVLEVLPDGRLVGYIGSGGEAFAMSWTAEGKAEAVAEGDDTCDLTTPYTPPPEPIKFRVWRVWSDVGSGVKGDKIIPHESSAYTLDDALYRVNLYKAGGYYLGHDFGPNDEGVEIVIERKAGE